MVRPKPRRIAFSMIAGLAILGVIAHVYFSPAAPSNAPAYTTDKVRRGDVTRVVLASGQLSPWSSVEVSSQISGLVTEVTVDFNSQVNKDQVLARLDPSTHKQRLLQAEAELAAAQANHALVTLNARRLHGLREQDLVTGQEYDQVKALLQQSDAELLTRKAAVENARVDLERCIIKSPIDGIVIYRQIEPGKTVVSSFSAPTLFVIAQDLAKMRIIAPINEVDVGALHPGQSATFSVDALSGKRFTGRLAQIRNPYTPTDKQEPQQTPQSSIASFDAVIEVDNSDLLLRPGLTATASIAIEQRKNVLLIPNGALRVEPPAEFQDVNADWQLEKPAGQSAELETVYRLQAGDRTAIPSAVTVHLGISDSISTEVLSGLREGDYIITGIATKAEITSSPSLLGN